MKYYQNKYNMYWRLESVNDSNKVMENLNKKNFIYSNQDIDLNEMFTINDEFLNMFGYKYRKNTEKKEYKHRYGIEIEILLPEEFNISFIKEFSISLFNFLMKNKNIKLPFYSYVIEKGQGRYLRCIIFEREYYTTPLTIEKKLTKNIYINSETKKYCKSNNPNAILLKAAGTVISTRQTNLSNKVEWFYFSNQKKNPFKDFQKKIDDFIISEFLTYGIPIMPSFFTQRINIKKYPLNYREGLKLLNKFLRDIDKMINNLEENLLVDTEIDYEKNPDYIELCQYVHFNIYPQLQKICAIKTNSEREFSTYVKNYISVAKPNFQQKINDIEINLFESFLL